MTVIILSNQVISPSRVKAVDLNKIKITFAGGEEIVTTAKPAKEVVDDYKDAVSKNKRKFEIE